MRFIQAFLMGMARLLDIGGTMGVPEPMSNEEAWASDWQAVGTDFEQALLQAQRDLTPEQARVLRENLWELYS